MAGLSYWGEGLKVMRDQLGVNGHSGINVHEASCGPVSSFHDRACEVFAQSAALVSTMAQIIAPMKSIGKLPKIIPDTVFFLNRLKNGPKIIQSF